MKITNGLIAAIVGFEPREVYNELQLGNEPTCLECGTTLGFVEPTIAAMRPLCDRCAFAFVREAAVIIDNFLDEENSQ